MKSQVLFLFLFFALAFGTAAPAGFAGNEPAQTGPLNTRGLEDRDSSLKPYDPNRANERSERKNYKKNHRLITTSQRPSDYLEDTPLGAAS